MCKCERKVYAHVYRQRVSELLVVVSHLTRKLDIEIDPFKMLSVRICTQSILIYFNYGTKHKICANCTFIMRNKMGGGDKLQSLG